MNQVREWLTQSDGLADQLRALREATGMSGKEFAAHVGWDPSKVSRLELGRQKPSAEDLAAWARACNASEQQAGQLLAALDELHAAHRAWRMRARAGHAGVQQEYNDLFTRCRHVAEFSTVFVSGLIQTPAYARRVFVEMKQLHDLPGDDVDKAVAARMQRQQLLYDESRTFEILLAEPVLLWGLCPPVVMRAQLDRIASAAHLPNVRFGILPLGTPLPVTPQNSFILFDDVAIIETFTAETVCREEESALYRQIMDRLWEHAAVGEDALRLVASAMDRHA